MYLPADQGIPLTALMIWSCSVLADITQVFLQCRRKWEHWTPGLGAGSWEDGNVTRLASWPVSASTRTVTYTLANKVLQMVFYPETSWAGRLCYGFETPILQLICSLLHSMFLPCCWQTLQHYWAEISSDHTFPNPSPTLSYCTAKLEPVLSIAQCLLEIFQNDKLILIKSNQAVLTWHPTWLHLTLPAWNGVLCSLS